MDIQLPYFHRIAIEMHLLMCQYCARFRRQLIMLRKMSRHIDGNQSGTEIISRLSKESKERIKKSLRSRL
jgi:hypothetical protein